MSQPTLPAIARATNRAARAQAVRAFFIGLGLDVAVAVTLVLLTAFNAIEWTSVYWLGLGSTLAKSILQAVVAFFARKLIPPKTVTNPF